MLRDWNRHACSLILKYVVGRKRSNPGRGTLYASDTLQTDDSAKCLENINAQDQPTCHSYFTHTSKVFLTGWQKKPDDKHMYHNHDGPILKPSALNDPDSANYQNQNDAVTCRTAKQWAPAAKLTVNCFPMQSSFLCRTTFTMQPVTEHIQQTELNCTWTIVKHRQT